MEIHYTGNFLPWHRWFTWSYEKALRDECGYNGYQPVCPQIFLMSMYTADDTISTGIGPNTLPLPKTRRYSTAAPPAWEAMARASSTMDLSLSLLMESTFFHCRPELEAVSSRPDHLLTCQSTWDQSEDLMAQHLARMADWDIIHAG